MILLHFLAAGCMFAGCNSNAMVDGDTAFILLECDRLTSAPIKATPSRNGVESLQVICLASGYLRSTNDGLNPHFIISIHSLASSTRQFRVISSKRDESVLPFAAARNLSYVS